MHSKRSSSNVPGIMRRVRAGLLLVACAAALLLVALLPATAHAKSYEMPRVDISAQANTDGSLHVTEQRTFDFSGDFTCVWWTFDNLPDNADITFNSMRMTTYTQDGTATTVDMGSVPFVLSWRDAGGPGTTAYSVDSPRDTVYAFFEASDQQVVFTLDYTVANGVQAYADVAEVYWQYVGSQWDEASRSVTMTIAVPVPSGETAVAGDTLRAWGHGPLDGSVSVNADAGSVTYTSPSVSSGQFAEARVVFPSSWLTNLDSSVAAGHAGDYMLDAIVAEEEVWADEANRDRVAALALVIGWAVLCVALIAASVVVYLKCGKEHDPDFKDEYWRDVPDPEIHPAVIGRLWRWNRESNDDFTATLMHLCHAGAIKINKGTYEKPVLLGRTETVEDYYLTLVPDVAVRMTDPVDDAVLRLLFGSISEGAMSLWFADITQYGKDHPQEFVDAMKDWQGLLTAQVNRHAFFDARSNALQALFVIGGIVLALVSIFVSIRLLNFIPALFGLPTAVVMCVIGNYMARRTVEGNNLVARCKALRNWLRDFSLLSERPPTDVRVWGEFMVYAYVFGVAEQAIKALQVKVPELFEGDLTTYDSPYVPWWFWYSSSYGSFHAPLGSAGDVLRESVANTIGSAQAALSAAKGGSGSGGGFSSGGGFGGGFSGGGGGGFGGGGGAR